MKCRSLVWLLLAVGVCVGEKVRFDNYRVYDVSIETDEQLKVLQYLEQFSDGVRLSRNLYGSGYFICELSFTVLILGLSGADQYESQDGRSSS